MSSGSTYSASWSRASSRKPEGAAAWPMQRLRGAGEVAQRLHVGGRHEARADQAMREEIGEPGRVVHVRLAARHSLDVGRVGQGELALHPLAQHSPDRLPAWVQEVVATP